MTPSDSTTDATPSWEIQGRTVTMPVEVRDAKAAVCSFLVPSRGANELMPDAYEVVEFLPGRTLLLLGCIDYIDNDLGDYNEVAINFFVKRRGEKSGGIPYLSAWKGMGDGSLHSFCWKMPVNQSFTRDAGDFIWGFPKTVERIDFDYSQEGSFGALLEMDGQKVFTLRCPRGGKLDRDQMDLASYTMISNIPHRTEFTQKSFGMGVKPFAKIHLELGPHPIGRTLRDLGLPRRPLMCMWTEKAVMTFGPPEKL